jgi:hypothetical protein
MPDLLLKSDILAPEHEKTLKFSLYHPSKIIGMVPELIREIFKVTGSNLFEDEIKWDTSGDITKFYGSWRGKDPKDARSTVWSNVKVLGEQSPKEKKGSITIWISGELIVKLPYKNILEKSIARLYSYMFYSEKRRKYTAEAKGRLGILEDEIRRIFEVRGR